jgi:hypothetical protein
LGLEQNNQIELSRQVRKFLANPEFELAIDNGSFDLGELVRIAGSLIPPIKVQGLLKVAGLQATGKMPGFKPESIGKSPEAVTLIFLSANLYLAEAGLATSSSDKKNSYHQLAQGLIKHDGSPKTLEGMYT